MRYPWHWKSHRHNDQNLKLLTIIKLSPKSLGISPLVAYFQIIVLFFEVYNTVYIILWYRSSLSRNKKPVNLSDITPEFRFPLLKLLSLLNRRSFTVKLKFNFLKHLFQIKQKWLWHEKYYYHYIHYSLRWLKGKSEFCLDLVCSISIVVTKMVFSGNFFVKKPPSWLSAGDSLISRRFSILII